MRIVFLVILGISVTSPYNGASTQTQETQGRFAKFVEHSRDPFAPKENGDEFTDVIVNTILPDIDGVVFEDRFGSERPRPSPHGLHGVHQIYSSLRPSKYHMKPSSVASAGSLAVSTAGDKLLASVDSQLNILGGSASSSMFGTGSTGLSNIGGSPANGSPLNIVGGSSVNSAINSAFVTFGQSAGSTGSTNLGGLPIFGGSPANSAINTAFGNFAQAASSTNIAKNSQGSTALGTKPLQKPSDGIVFDNPQQFGRPKRSTTHFGGSTHDDTRYDDGQHAHLVLSIPRQRNHRHDDYEKNHHNRKSFVESHDDHDDYNHRSPVLTKKLVLSVKRNFDKRQHGDDFDNHRDDGDDYNHKGPVLTRKLVLSVKRDFNKENYHGDDFENHHVSSHNFDQKIRSHNGGNHHNRNFHGSIDSLNDDHYFQHQSNSHDFIPVPNFETKANHESHDDHRFLIINDKNRNHGFFRQRYETKTNHKSYGDDHDEIAAVINHKNYNIDNHGSARHETKINHQPIIKSHDDDKIAVVINHKNINYDNHDHHNYDPVTQRYQTKTNHNSHVIKYFDDDDDDDYHNDDDKMYFAHDSHYDDTEDDFDFDSDDDFL